MPRPAMIIPCCIWLSLGILVQLCWPVCQILLILTQEPCFRWRTMRETRHCIWYWVLPRQSAWSNMDLILQRVEFNRLGCAQLYFLLETTRATRRTASARRNQCFVKQSQSTSILSSPCHSSIWLPWSWAQTWTTFNASLPGVSTTPLCASYLQGSMSPFVSWPSFLPQM